MQRQDEDNDQLTQPYRQQEHARHPQQHRVQIPTRRRGREPPQPITSALDDGVADDGEGDQLGGWQLHHSSTGLPFYLCVRPKNIFTAVS